MKTGKNRTKALGWGLALCVVLLPAGRSFADSTYVSGPISTNTTWVTAHSPYVVVGNVLVVGGVTLTIQPGVKVLFDSLKALQIDGELVARGTISDTIRFTSRRTPPSPGDWGYILFRNSSTDARFDSLGNYVSGCILEYCELSYGGASLGGDGMVRADSAHPYLAHCAIHHGSSYGINANGLSSLLKLTDCDVEDNGGGISLNYGSPIITGCRIARNIAPEGSAGGGIWVGYGVPTISGCVITDNQTQGQYEGSNGGGICLYYCPSATIRGCTITGNHASVRGGGIYTDCDSTAIIGNWISNNTASHGWTCEDAGGAIYVVHGVFISNNIIAGNGATNGYGGGGIACAEYARGRVAGNVLRGNSASKGGGIAVNMSGSISVLDNIITHNVAYGTNPGDGAGILVYASSYAAIQRNVFADDSAGEEGTAMQLEGPCDVDQNAVIRNTGSGYGSAVNLYTGDGRDFRYNTVTQNRNPNAGPVVWINSHMNVNYNNMFENDATYELVNWNAQSSGNLDVKSNWWGSRAEGDIQREIYDWFDDASRSIADYTPWDTAIRTDCPISPPTGVSVRLLGGDTALVTWNANPESDLEGYIVHWDTTNDTLYPFAHHVNVGRTTTCILTGLTPRRYFITVTAYDADYDSTHNLPNTVINECQTEGNESWYAEGAYTTVTGVGQGGEPPLPRVAELGGVAPSPCSQRATISYALPTRMRVKLAVYDVQGRQVAVLAKDEEPAGRHQARLDVRKLANGVYFCRLQAGGETMSRKLIVQR